MPTIARSYVSGARAFLAPSSRLRAPLRKGRLNLDHHLPSRAFILAAALPAPLPTPMFSLFRQPAIVRPFLASAAASVSTVSRSAAVSPRIVASFSSSSSCSAPSTSESDEYALEEEVRLSKDHARAYLHRSDDKKPVF